MEWKLPAAVRAALARLNGAGYAAYIVGGCVRDQVLGFPPHDWDICTAATPPQMQEIFRGERTIETGLKHGTLTVLLAGEPLEITTFRTDGEYLDGRRPVSVQFTASLEEDLSRRDFTINAMAYHPGEGLIDLFGGREDCAAGIIRCVGEPEQRFQEDALRILRALRFSSRLGFAIEADTAAALRAMGERLNLISRERIASEMEGILLGAHTAEILENYGDVLSIAVGEQGIPWKAIAPQTAQMAAELPLRWAAALAPLGREKAAAVLRGLKVSRKLQGDVTRLLAWQDAALSPEKMQYLLMKLGEEGLRSLISFAWGMGKIGTEEREALLDRLEGLLSENACHTLAQLAVSGEELSRLGTQGAFIGQTLQTLLTQVTLGEIENQKEILLRQAQALLAEKES